MATKIIPFDKTIADKVLSGEIKGTVYKDRTKRIVVDRILCTDAIGKCPIIYTKQYPDRNLELPYMAKFSDLKIELEVSNEQEGKHEFKPYDKVLTRDFDDHIWEAGLFSHYEVTDVYGTEEKTLIYACVGNAYATQCIPFYGNEHLLGTTDKPKED